MRGDRLLARTPVRMMIIGPPGSAKTGSQAALVNLGYKLRVLDYDGNPESLLMYTDPDKLKNIDIVTLADPLQDMGNYIGVRGIPQAFTKGFRLLDKWRYEDPEGDEIELGKDGQPTGKRFTDLGKSKDWGLDTIISLDGITGQATASFERGMQVAQKTPLTVSQPMWQFAINEQEKMIRHMKHRNHHVIVMAHPKLIGPQDIEKGDSDLTKQIKEAEAKHIPTRYYPSALGRALPQTIMGHFPIVVRAHVKTVNKKSRRVFSVLPVEEVDLKLPVKVEDLVKMGELPIETGLATIFAALGHRGPQ